MNQIRLGTERVSASFRLIAQLSPANNLFATGETMATNLSTGSLIRQNAPPVWVSNMPTNFNVTFGIPSFIDLSLDVSDPDGNIIKLAMAGTSAALPPWLTLDSANERLVYDGTGPSSGVVQAGLIVAATDVFLVATNLASATGLSVGALFANGVLVATNATTQTSLSTGALSTPTLIATNLASTTQTSSSPLTQSGTLVADSDTTQTNLSTPALSQGSNLVSVSAVTATTMNTPAIVSQNDPIATNVVRRNQMQGTVQVARIQ